MLCKGCYRDATCSVFPSFSRFYVDGENDSNALRVNVGHLRVNHFLFFLFFFTSIIITYFSKKSTGSIICTFGWLTFCSTKMS